MIGKECEVSVSLETKRPAFLRLHKRQNGWKEKNREQTLSLFLCYGQLVKMFADIDYRNRNLDGKR